MIVCPYILISPEQPEQAREIHALHNVISIEGSPERPEQARADDIYI